MEKHTVSLIKLKPKTKKKNFLEKLKNLFEDKKKRYLYMLLFMLPFIIGILVFSIISFKEAKTLMNLASGETEVADDHKIESMNYVLRDNATDIQFEYFTELKETVESGTYDDTTVAGLVCKNYVADFFTWSNKQGQYDVGGLYYVFDGELTEGTNFKENVYLQARETFYKYINNYINNYGAENILEVESVNVDSATKCFDSAIISEHVANLEDENGDWYDYRENSKYDTFLVKCSWTYKPSEKFSTSKYPTSMYFLVIKRNNQFQIIETSSSKIEVYTDGPFNEQIQEVEEQTATEDQSTTEE